VAGKKRKIIEFPKRKQSYFLALTRTDATLEAALLVPRSDESGAPHRAIRVVMPGSCSEADLVTLLLASDGQSSE